MKKKCLETICLFTFMPRNSLQAYRKEIVLKFVALTVTPYNCPQFPVIVHSSISGIIDYKTLPQIDLYIVA